ncbi:hypothetical protein SNEBB_000813 [Seison nebaliae]|nr:hypothetical protein SNEBB_000813 [Seison nebaliae]
MLKEEALAAIRDIVNIDSAENSPDDKSRLVFMIDINGLSKLGIVSNVLIDTMFKELILIFRELNSEDKVQLIVIIFSSNKGFCYDEVGKRLHTELDDILNDNKTDSKLHIHIPYEGDDRIQCQVEATNEIKRTDEGIVVIKIQLILDGGKGTWDCFEKHANAAKKLPNSFRILISGTNRVVKLIENFVFGQINHETEPQEVFSELKKNQKIKDFQHNCFIADWKEDKGIEDSLIGCFANIIDSVVEKECNKDKENRKFLYKLYVVYMMRVAEGKLMGMDQFTSFSNAKDSLKPEDLNVYAIYSIENKNANLLRTCIDYDMIKLKELDVDKLEEVKFDAIQPNEIYRNFLKASYLENVDKIPLPGTKNFYMLYCYCVIHTCNDLNGTNLENSLSYVVWENSENPIHYALLTASLLRMFVKNEKIVRKNNQKVVLDVANDWEKLAIRIFRQVTHKYDQLNEDLFILPIEEDIDITIPTLVENGECQMFASDEPMQNYIDAIWYPPSYQLPENSSMIIFELFFCAILVFPYWILKKRKRFKDNKITIREFFSSPCITYIHRVLAYIVHLSIFTYWLVEYKKKLWYFEIYSFGFHLAQILTELVQTKLCVPSRSCCRVSRCSINLKKYLAEDWNRIDLIIIIFTIVAFIIRVVEQFSPMNTYVIHVTKLFYITGETLLFARMLNFLETFETIGPKVFAIKKMIGNVLGTLPVFFSIIIAGSVGFQSYLFHRDVFRFKIITRNLFSSFTYMLGEYEDFEKIEGNIENCYERDEYLKLINKNNVDEPYLCPKKYDQFHWPYFLLCIYVVISSIILVNLIVAFFTSAFESVEQEARITYGYRRYFFVKEFKDMYCGIIPPIDTLVTIYCFLRDCRKNRISPNVEKTKTEVLKKLFGYEKMLYLNKEQTSQIQQIQEVFDFRN